MRALLARDCLLLRSHYFTHARRRNHHRQAPKPAAASSRKGTQKMSIHHAQHRSHPSTSVMYLLDSTSRQRQVRTHSFSNSARWRFAALSHTCWLRLPVSAIASVRFITSTARSVIASAHIARFKCTLKKRSPQPAVPRCHARILPASSRSPRGSPGRAAGLVAVPSGAIVASIVERADMQPRNPGRKHPA